MMFFQGFDFLLMKYTMIRMAATMMKAHTTTANKSGGSNTATELEESVSSFCDSMERLIAREESVEVEIESCE